MGGRALAVPQAGRRIEWIDCAKGAAVLLIVLHHATSYETAIFGQTLTLPVFNWRNLDLFLYHIRLPVFFFVSGVAASGHLSSRATGPNWTTARGYALLYLLWSLALLTIVPDWPNFDPGHRPGLTEIADIALGQSTVWYLWAILLCLAYARLTAALPGWIAILIAVAAYAALDAAVTLPGHLPALTRSLPFYLLGFRRPTLATGEIHLPRGSIAAFVLVAAAVAWSGLSAALTNVLLDLAGLGAGMALARQLPGRLPAAVGPLGWIGRRTLPIYILHFPIIAGVGVATVGLIGPLPMNHPLVLIYAPVLAAGAVAASLVLHIALQRLGAGWMFALGGKGGGHLKKTIS